MDTLFDIFQFIYGAKLLADVLIPETSSGLNLARME
jgi:hypothetical protein